jgi:BirA family biotin operon repressor/biotin-[acetyl-CoA-carboxylase] ligase
MEREGIDPEGWLEHFIWEPEVGSTNDHARQWLEMHPQVDGPLLVVADRQTAGRGRGAHRWWSPEGCLMASVGWNLAPTPRRPEDRSQWGLIVGLAAAEAITPVVRPGVGLKWPNDLYLQGRKVAGILVESQGRGDLVIGIGVNVSVDFEKAPEEVRERAISLQPCLSQPVDRCQILERFLRCLDHTIRHWQTDPDFLFQSWQNYCLLRGKKIRVEELNRTTEGRCLGIDPHGRLMVQPDFGEPISVLSGTILPMEPLDRVALPGIL